MRIPLRARSIILVILAVAACSGIDQIRSYHRVVVNGPEFHAVAAQDLAGGGRWLRLRVAGRADRLLRVVRCNATRPTTTDRPSQ